MTTVTTHPFHDDKLHEECGVYGIFNHQDAASLTALGLHALQHRGQESAGIISGHNKEDTFHSHRGFGLVGDIFGSQDVIETLKGNRAIGHVRYATSGKSAARNIQPLFADFAFGPLALAHNGNLTNSKTLRRELIKKGSLFQSTTDTEVFIHLISTSPCEKVADRLVDAAKQIKGAYSLVALTNKKLIGMRDAMGIRPLVLGRLNDSWILTSETVALDITGAEFVRDIEPGEIIIISNKEIKSIKPFKEQEERLCIFEYIYFARPDSIMNGKSIYDVRKKIGSVLAQESSDLQADVIIPIPDSGIPAALGFSQTSQIPFELGIIRNHYVGRTFIEPTDQIRHLGVKLKHNANIGQIKGKRIVLVDDSIVRGTTSTKIVHMMRMAGAKEVHMRISSPPTMHPCFYGIDTPAQERLLAHQHNVAEMEKIIGVDSLKFLSLPGLYRAIEESQPSPQKSCKNCDACFTGNYPIELVDHEACETEKLTSFSEREF